MINIKADEARMMLAASEHCRAIEKLIRAAAKNGESTVTVLFKEMENVDLDIIYRALEEKGFKVDFSLTISGDGILAISWY